MFFSELEEDEKTIPDGIVPLYNFLDFILNWREQSNGINSLIRTDEYCEIIEIMNEEIPELFPEFIAKEFFDCIALIEKGDSIDVSQISDTISFLKLQIDRYYESKHMLFDPELYEDSEVNELDDSIVYIYGLSACCQKQIKYFCKKISTIMYAMEIREYILTQDYPTSKADLEKRFGNLNKFTLSLILSSGDIINCRNTFFAIINIVNDSYTLNILEKLLDDKKQHSATEIYQLFVRKNEDFLSQNHIDTALQLYMVLAHIYSGCFKFSWPFVADKSIALRNQNEIIFDYVKSRNIINVTELIAYARKNDIVYPSTIDFLDSFNHTVIFKNKSELLSIRMLNLTESDIKCIKTLIKKDLKMSYGKAIRDLTVIHKFPKIHVLWDEWLIYSIVKRYIPELCVGLSSTQFRFSVPVIALTNKELSVAREQARRKYSYTRVEQIVFEADNIDDIDNLIADCIEFELDEALI